MLLPSVQYFPQPFPNSLSLSSLYSADTGTKPTILGMKRCPLIRSPEILKGLKCFHSWHWKLEIFTSTADSALEEQCRRSVSDSMQTSP